MLSSPEPLASSYPQEDSREHKSSVSGADACSALASDLVEYFVEHGGNADFMLPAFVQMLGETEPDLACRYMVKFDEIIMEMIRVDQRRSTDPAKGI